MRTILILFIEASVFRAKNTLNETEVRIVRAQTKMTSEREFLRIILDEQAPQATECDLHFFYIFQTNDLT